MSLGLLIVNQRWLGLEGTVGAIYTVPFKVKSLYKNILKITRKCIMNFNLFLLLQIKRFKTFTLFMVIPWLYLHKGDSIWIALILKQACNHFFRT